MSEPIAITAERLIPFTPTSLAGRVDPLFHLKVPTPDQRDMLATTLSRMGVRPVSQEIMRATLIDALYDRGNDEQADLDAEMLETFWQTGMLDEQALASWHEQEIERQRDIAAGAPWVPPVPMPKAVTSARMKAKARLLVDEMTTSSPRMIALLERQMDYNRHQAFVLVRIGVAATSMPGLKLEFGIDGYLTEASAHAIRNALADTVWLELIEKIDESYRLTGEEEKNSVSPLEPPSGPSGSAEPSDASASSDGKWTDSNTGPAPSDASATTTG